ncbi:MAG: hypothetical protein UR26_C0005G0019 [candidate division TM6 bacterium GW2011_GWF2_32_72]|nr:MAG: hypothetical protein UR26_C0005G0019 [candidate division TM6 bacterium GW2011_GWF2_32_72]
MNKKILLILPAIIYAQLVFADINIFDLKDTWNILKPEYKHLSPIHGGIWWESGLVKNFYTFGKTFDTPTRNDKVVELTREVLFNEIEGDLGVATGELKFINYFDQKDIGKLIGLIESHQKQEQENEFKTQVTELIEKQKEKLPENINKNKFNIKTPVNILTAALKNCGWFQPTEEREKKKTEYKIEYPKNTVIYLLLATLYRKGTTNKENLKTFYDGLAEGVGKEVLTKDGINTLQNTNWPDQKYTVQELKKTSEEEAFPQEHLIDPILILEKNYEKIVVKLLFNPGYPPQTGSFRTHYKNNAFLSCADNALRNFVNLIAYSKEGIFSTENVKKITTQAKPIQSLKEYIDQQNKTGSAEKHWLKVVENLPWVKYKKALNKKTKKVIQTNAFIYLPNNDEMKQALENKKIKVTEKTIDDQTFDQFTWGKDTYVIVDPSEYELFEIKSCLANFILILNQIFQLDIFKNQNIYETFLDSNFYEIYTAKIAEKLNFTYSTTEKLKTGYASLNVAFPDKRKAIISLRKGHASCNFHSNIKKETLILVKYLESMGYETLISYDLVPVLMKYFYKHFYIGGMPFYIENPITTTSINLKYWFLTNISSNDANNLKMLETILSNKFLLKELPKPTLDLIKIISNKTDITSLSYFLEEENQSKKKVKSQQEAQSITNRKFIEQYGKLFIQELNKTLLDQNFQKENLKTSLMLAITFKDFIQKDITSSIIEKIIEAPDAIQTKCIPLFLDYNLDYNKEFYNENITQQLVNLSEHAIKSQNSTLQNLGFDLLAKLVEVKRPGALETAIQFALQFKEKETNRHQISLLLALLRHGPNLPEKLLDKAIEIAQQAVAVNSSNINNYGRSLVEELYKRGKLTRTQYYWLKTKGMISEIKNDIQGNF